MKFNYKPLWQAFVLRFLRFIFLLSRWLPLRSLLWLGTVIGMLAYRVSQRYRNVAMRNLNLAYGDTLTTAQKRRITREVFINFTKSAMEFPVAARMSSEQIRELAYLSDEDAAVIDGLQSLGHGLVAISAHLGNFELMARRFVVQGYSFTVVVRNDNNKAVAEAINNIRLQSGYDVIGRGEAARPLLRKLRSGSRETVGMLPDQKSDEVFVPFFGVVTGTVAGPAVVSLRTGAPILPMFSVRLPGDKHKIVLGTPIFPESTSDREADAERMMIQVNLEIEKVVRAYPEQWLWLHDRWKVKPPPEIAARWEASHDTGESRARKILDEENVKSAAY